jgi:hypothetical protein
VQHLAAFHARIGFDLGILGAILLDPLEQVHAELAVRKLAAAEAQSDLHLVAFADELVDRLHLRIIIMIVDVRTHLDLLDLLRLLALPGEVRLFLRLVLELADIEELGDGRVRIGGHLDQVEPEFLGLFHRLARVHHAEILALMVDHADLGRLNEFVKPRTVHRRCHHRAAIHGRTYTTCSCCCGLRVWAAQ